MRALLVCVCAVFCAATISAEVGQPKDVASRARGAGRIVVAQVEDVDARFDVNEHGDRLIISRAWLRVEETLKGVHADIIQMDIEGGTIGDLTLQVSDMPGLRKGERGVFFLESTPSGAHRPHDRGFGIVKLDASNRAAALNLELPQLRAAIRAAAR